ncbi:hypothetical protein NHH03_22070 [Stieleria sp. TO1_6]|uniref:hypothetical protein n=1 Tax=Stieleria tagensis TaxID=2956795 RepID=UPI00209B099A|nr:hypothetical protein [Stieleria tagensis]MCO8124442.1 hypothetical protein [Stieleria tagensis]
MRIQWLCLGLFCIGPMLFAVTGCGRGSEATVAPRSAEEVEAYKQQVYGAEEEDSSGAQ